MDLLFKANIEVTEHGIYSLFLSPAPSFSWTIHGNLKWKKAIDQWMESYLAKEFSPLNIPLDLLDYPLFTQNIFQEMSKIPFGKTYSYSGLATRLGKPKAARAVGGACGRNQILLMIPCHRIIASDGTLGGFSAGLPIKEQLLKFEGHPEF